VIGREAKVLVIPASKYREDGVDREDAIVTDRCSVLWLRSMKAKDGQESRATSDSKPTSMARKAGGGCKADFP
jgi:hypothetical protein